MVLHRLEITVEVKEKLDTRYVVEAASSLVVAPGFPAVLVLLQPKGGIIDFDNEAIIVVVELSVDRLGDRRSVRRRIEAGNISLYSLASRA